MYTPFTSAFTTGGLTTSTKVLLSTTLIFAVAWFILFVIVMIHASGRWVIPLSLLKKEHKATAITMLTTELGKANAIA
jgi:hypothetical protein